MNITYLRYLRSSAWAAKRRQVLERDGYRCQAWVQHVATEVHHKSYEHFGDELLDDLISFCRACHEAITSIVRRDRHQGRRIKTQDTLRITPKASVLSKDDTFSPKIVDMKRLTPGQWRNDSHGVQELELQTHRRFTPALP